MSTTVAVYKIREHTRSRVLCDAAITGASAYGDTVIARYEDEYAGIEADVAVFYGLTGNTPRLFKEYSAAAKAVYIDLGYWGRREGGRWTGYHKLVANDRHPTQYFQNVAHDGRRLKSLGVSISPWRRPEESKWRDHILIAGMGDKGAEAEGYDVEEWERGIIKAIRSVTSRPIVYRPKPSWKQARRIQGVGYSSPTQGLHKALDGCHMVVTHHSNVAVDALVLGIPAFVVKGAALPMCTRSIDDVEAPAMPDGRQQWINDLSYCQWSVDEIRRGLAWKHMKSESLI